MLKLDIVLIFCIAFCFLWKKGLNLVIMYFIYFAVNNAVFGASGTSKREVILLDALLSTYLCTQRRVSGL